MTNVIKSLIFGVIVLSSSYVGAAVSESHQNKDHFFCVIIPSYNNKDCYKQNLDALMAQDAYYQRWVAVYIDDCSTDGTGDLVEAYVKERGFEHKIRVIKNTKRLGALANVWRVVHGCPDDAIIIVYDGDDWWAHNQALRKINSVYQDPNVWISYGQYYIYPQGTIGQCEAFPHDIIKERAFRKYKWVSSAPRTFYAGLFKKINIEDLHYNHHFYLIAGDCAYMFPMMEMAPEHIRFIPEILYVYNCANPISDFRIAASEQARIAAHIRNKPLYDVVSSWKNE